LLGDAHISRRSPTANSRLYYGQSSKHKEYFFFVFDLFKSFCVKNYTPQFTTINDKRNNETYTSFHFATMQFPCFNIFWEMFYVGTIKIVPTNIY